MSFKLITDDDVKALSKSTLGTAYDTLFNDTIITAIGESFAAYCGRVDFDAKSRTEYFSPRPYQSFIFLASPPLATSPAVQLWEDSSLPRAYSAGTEKINGTDFFVFEAEGMLQKHGWFTAGAKAVKVTYTGGYLTADATGCPADLKLAAITQAKIIFERREQYGMTGQSIVGASVSILTPLTLPKQVTLYLDRYKVYANAA